MPSSQIAQFDHSYDGVIDPLRFEFARRDVDLSATTPVTLSATRQWPQHARPAERRILFHLWEQR